jgi:DNA-binding cell septation regulator SpoVG
MINYFEEKIKVLVIVNNSRIIWNIRIDITLEKGLYVKMPEKNMSKTKMRVEVRM